VIMTVEEIADELVKLWSMNRDADQIDELRELYRRLGLDFRGSDKTLIGEAYALAAKKMAAKGIDIILMNVRLDDKPRQKPEDNP
jgi:hypothetical protein